ncbi:MAG: glycosyltransferase family 2 protein [bacterium]
MIYIIIISWNKLDDIVDCLNSIFESLFDGFKIIIVDNASEQEIVKTIHNKFPHVVIIENKTNLGFAEGNNIGIDYALKEGASDILLLNNDVIIDPKMIGELFKVLHSDCKIGIVGPKVYYYGDQNILQSVGEKFDENLTLDIRANKNIDKGQFDRVEEVDFTTGCALMIKTEVIKKIGHFDPKFYMYWEETDLCFRAKNAGYSIIYVPKAKMWHKGGAVSTPIITYYMTRNKLFFLKKHKFGSIKILKTLFGNIKTILSWSIRAKWKDKFQERNMAIKAIIDFLLNRTGRFIV